MGGILCVRRSWQEENGPDACNPAVEVFSRRGQKIQATLATDDWSIFVFSKVKGPTENVLQVPGGDFLAAVGTLLFRGRTGRNALELLHEHLSSRSDWPPDIRGHFALVARRGDSLYLFNDYGGLFRLYADDGLRIISSSLLALLKVLPRRTIARQELYEYLSHGASYGDRTIFSEVRLLDSRRRYLLGNDVSVERQPEPASPFQGRQSFREMVEIVASELGCYGADLSSIFGDEIATALSGGYDSRLTLAMLRRAGSRPWVYVYGPPTSADVRIAETIARGEGFDLHRGKEKPATVPEEEFPALIRDQLYFHDGSGIAGVFYDIDDLAARRERVSHAWLQLNGGGGEIYRNFWKLPDRSFSIDDFLRARYQRIDFSIYTDLFHPGEYWGTMADKIRHALEIDRDVMSRREVELLYPLFRLKYWMGQNNTSNNLLSYALTPFSEPSFSIPSADIPLRWKNYGVFEAELIRLLDARLASYPSQYGYSFERRPPLSARIRQFAKNHAPVFVRPLFYRQRQARSTRAPLPYYFSERYVSRVLDLGNMEVRRYVKLENLRDPVIRSRALTVELLLQDRF